MTTVVAFDTLKFVRRLRDAGVEERQAEAFSDAFREVQDAQLEELATREDFAELRGEIAGLREDIERLEESTKKEFKRQEESTKRDLKELEIRMEATTEKTIGPIRTDLAVLKWMTTVMVTGILALLIKAFFPA
ncbi:MAG: DUF1640 domain-containing protein [Magnetococcales bacterium]|nr:DUF1640 domain-containing protein [Magnetococcales bacterium]